MANKISQEESKAIIIIVAAVFAMVLIGILVSKLFKAGSSILEKVGVKADPITKAAATQVDTAIDKDAAAGIQSPWSPEYYKKVAPDYLKSASINKFCQDVAKMIYDGIGVFSDSPDTIIAAFKKINSLAGLSAVASCFSLKYNYDLLTFLKDRLDTPKQIQAMSTILTYVSKLPKTA